VALEKEELDGKIGTLPLLHSIVCIFITCTNQIQNISAIMQENIMESKIQLLKIWELITEIPDHCVIYHDESETKVISAYITTQTLHNSLHGRKETQLFTILSTGKLPPENDDKVEYEQIDFNDLFRSRKEYEGYMIGKNYGI
jgi:hypothetical protein